MDQQGGRMVSDAAAKVGDTVNDLAAKTEKMVEDKVDQGKPVLRDLQASAGAAIDKVAGLARDASSAGIQAVAQAGDAIQGGGREGGTRGDQAPTGGYQSRYAAKHPLTAPPPAGAIAHQLAYLKHRN